MILCTTATICSGNEEKLTIECLKRYLKDRKINEDILSYVNPYVGSLTDCESAVKSKLADLYSGLRNKLSSNRSLRPFVECAMRDIEEEDDESYEHLVLREAAVEMVSNWRFWSYFTKSSRLESLQASAKGVVDKSMLKCKGHRDFGDLFVNINEAQIVWDRSGEEEFCIRTYLVTKNLLNPVFYNFRDNPRNVRTQDLDCAPVIATAINKVYQEISETRKIDKCSLDVYRDNNYADYLLKAEVLAKLTLTKSDKSREKQDFINSMVDITYDTRKC